MTHYSCDYEMMNADGSTVRIKTEMPSDMKIKLNSKNELREKTKKQAHRS